MFEVRCLLSVLLILALTQTASAWWFKRKDCPQQQYCPLNCYSGFVTSTDYRGCTKTLCKCNDVCEYFQCPKNTRCQRKFHCKRFGGCSVYPTCVVVLNLTPTKANFNPVTTEGTTTTSTTKATTTSKTATTTTTVTTSEPSTPLPTTRIVEPTRKSVQITRKTSAPSLCQNGGDHLARWRCGPQEAGSRPCPESHQCENAGGNRYVCCPLPKTTTTTTTTTPVPPTTTPVPQESQTEAKPTFCRDGRPHLEGWHCGRGGERCPSSYKCVIHPADRYAVCCPIPVPDDEPQTPTSTQGLPMCEQPLKVGFCKGSLPRWHYNSETQECDFFRFGGCEGNANSFRSKKACESACGKPGKGYCSLEPQVGRCRAAFKKYYYDTVERKCKDFVYGGCEGNGNNFATLEQCEQLCY